MQLAIGNIAEKATVVQPSTKCERVYQSFSDIPSLEGIVVCENNHPVGLVSKTHFYQALSTKYGFNLFMNRTIDLIMNKEPLIVDYSVPITDVSALAMNRSIDHLYDYVIVTYQNQMYGIVSIKNLLIKLTEVQVSIARNSNPLSGLPGNFVIKEKLQEILNGEMFSVLYLDLNSFKAFNDTYGFKEGDEVIKETANLIVKTVNHFYKDTAFVGHIGGDDFIAILPNFSYKEVCESIIEKFDSYSKRYYNNDQGNKGFIQAVTRRGIIESVPILGISIAVVTNKKMSFETVGQLSKEAAYVKKQCKAFNKSYYLTVEDCLESKKS